MWKLAYKGIDVVLVFSVVVLHSLLESLIQMQWQEVVFVNSVQDCNALLKLCVRLIVVRHDRR